MGMFTFVVYAKFKKTVRMLQDSIIIKQRHKRFIKKACESVVALGLENENGLATSSSSK